MSHIANIDLIILFFILGVVAAWVKSDFELPDSISYFLSIFLLLSLGLKGGHEVRTAEDLSGFGLTLSLGLASCILIPTYLFFWLKKKIGEPNAASIAACYGSVSAVTLIAAQGFLENEKIMYSGYMVAVMAIMEVPAIVLALYFAKGNPRSRISPWLSLLSMFKAKSVILLLGGFAIGFLMNESSWASIAPVVQDSFRGVLAFFLLGLGVAAQKQLIEAWRFRLTAVFLACVLPLVHGTIAMFFGKLLDLPEGDLVLISVLIGSASYIAAPAAIRASIPEANPSLYIGLPLALTFPMNVLIGIPWYLELARF